MYVVGPHWCLAGGQWYVYFEIDKFDMNVKSVSFYDGWGTLWGLPSVYVKFFSSPIPSFADQQAKTAARSQVSLLGQFSLLRPHRFNDQPPATGFEGRYIRCSAGKHGGLTKDPLRAWVYMWGVSSSTSGKGCVLTGTFVKDPPGTHECLRGIWPHMCIFSKNRELDWCRGWKPALISVSSWEASSWPLRELATHLRGNPRKSVFCQVRLSKEK